MNREYILEDEITRLESDRSHLQYELDDRKTINSALGTRVEELTQENQSLKSQLTPFLEGIPLEEADKKKAYQIFDIFGEPRRVTHRDNSWWYQAEGCSHPIDNHYRLYLLPSQNSQTQEGS